MPVVTGHETSGIVVKIGENVKGFMLGDKVTADNSELCGYCHFCRQGKMLYCENFLAHGIHRRYSRKTSGWRETMTDAMI
jgi:D-arabinitol dehydrogenase (NADP+)